MSACPFCHGRGRTVAPGAVDGSEIVLTCDACSATGDLEMMRYMRAFRLGQAHEHARVVADLVGTQAPGPMGAEAIKRAILDDDSRLRYEEHLRSLCTGANDELVRRA